VDIRLGMICWFRLQEAVSVHVDTSAS